MFPPVPLPLLADSYKASHYALYPANAVRMTAYAEFRQGFDKDTEDQRVIFWGLAYLIEQYVAKRWTMEMVEQSAHFYSTHYAPAHTAYPFPRALFEKFVRENDGYFPVRIEAVRDGSVVYPHVPVYQITATDEYSPLCTYLETILTMVWYPSTVATLSRRARDLIEAAFETSVDADMHMLVESRLHDFGFRACTSVEQSIIGGVAHLLNFDGTDTPSAAYYAQYHLNDGEPIGQAIPATEHSVMTAWPSEKEAMLNEIEKFGDGLFACVMDSYDYAAALEKLLPTIRAKKLEKGGFLVLRPDSGDPVETVMMALRAVETVFGCDLNGKGFKVIRGCSVIQGDGVNIRSIKAILDTVVGANYSAQNVAFGMGGGLLQKVNRDTMSFATKLCHIKYATGVVRDIMKTPKTDKGKFSLPGELTVVRDSNRVPMVYPKLPSHVAHPENMYHCVYDNGRPLEKSPTKEKFSAVRQRLNEEWHAMPRQADVVSQELRDKVKVVMQEQAERTAAMLAAV